MASESCMESSLRRSSKLGQDVLEKAKRRSINWPSAKPSPMISHKKDLERNISHANLDHAFATIVEYMAETTRQCKAFHKSVHQAEPNEREHICRYHRQDMLKTSDQKRNDAETIDRDFGTSEDFFIEVSPGTYSITAAMQDARPATKTVRITAGESKSLRFYL